MSGLAGAMADAALAWRQSILHLGWHHFLAALLYLAAAGACLLNAHVAPGSGHARRGWHAAALVLCLLAADSVLHAELWLAAAGRSLAHAQGWYRERRLLQYLLLAPLALAIVWSARLLHRALAASGAAGRDVAAGLAVLTLLCALRMVSAHHTDLVLNLRLAGIPVSRLLEFASIVAVAGAALHNLRLR